MIAQGELERYGHPNIRRRHPSANLRVNSGFFFHAIARPLRKIPKIPPIFLAASRDLCYSFAISGVRLRKLRMVPQGSIGQKWDISLRSREFFSKFLPLLPYVIISVGANVGCGDPGARIRSGDARAIWSSGQLMMRLVKKNQYNRAKNIRTRGQQQRLTVHIHDVASATCDHQALVCGTFGHASFWKRAMARWQDSQRSPRDRFTLTNFHLSTRTAASFFSLFCSRTCVLFITLSFVLYIVEQQFSSLAVPHRSLLSEWFDRLAHTSLEVVTNQSICAISRRSLNALGIPRRDSFKIA